MLMAAMGKKEFRIRAKKNLTTLSCDERESCDRLIGSHLALLISKLGHGAQTLGCYSPIQSEVQWLDHSALKSVNVDFVWPVLDKELPTMMYYTAKDNQIAYCSKKAGLPTNLIEETRVPDILLVPGLLFSEQCQRLGRGGGYFDRYLEEFKGITIGLAYQRQINNFFPIEPNDRSCDFIITEKCIYKKDMGVG
jgi:5-formyltetrahydrofolate cyclo-ligase